MDRLLILRGVAFEFRGKIDSPRWRNAWDWVIVGGSAAPALQWCVAFGNLVHGVPLDPQHHFTGIFFTLLNPNALMGGLATLSLFAFHGSVFLTLKTTDALRDRARTLARALGGTAIVFGGAFLGYTAIEHGGWSWLTSLIAALLLVAADAGLPR